jgi:hypothetical protein
MVPELHARMMAEEAEEDEGKWGTRLTRLTQCSGEG